MASGSGQNKRSMDFKDVDGYIHGVSEVKTPPSGNRYFDFKIQEREEERRVICFSPDKRDGIKEKESCKSPVRLLSVSPQKRKYDPDQTEYKFTNCSKVLVTKNLAFPWVGSSDAKKELTVQEIYDTSVSGDIVSIKAKVFWKGENETVYSRAMQKELKKCDIVLADVTAAILGTIWEDTIPMINVQQSYVWSNLKVGFFKRKCVNGTTNSAVSVCDDVALSVESSTAAEQLKPKERESQDVNGRIVAVDINKCFICISCKHRIGAAINDSKFLQCSSCKLRMLKENMDSTVSGSVIIVDESGKNLGRFYCQGPVLNAMFRSVSETENYNISATNVAQLSRDMITETLLLIKKVLFKISPPEKLVVEMKVCPCKSE